MTQAKRIRATAEPPPFFAKRHNYESQLRLFDTVVPWGCWDELSRHLAEWLRKPTNGLVARSREDEPEVKSVASIELPY
jgi:hypothetical protein